MSWRLHPLKAFADHTRAWDDLNRRGMDTPLLDTAFLTPLIEEFATGDEILATYGNSADPTAMGLFHRATHFSWQTFQPANAPLGAWMCRRDESLAPLLRALMRSLPGPSLLVGLTQQDPDMFPRPAASACLGTSDYIQTARINITMPFEDYWAARGKNLRHNIKRQHNRLRREGFATRLECLSEAADMNRAVADYARLELSGWKGEAASAVHVDDPQGRFYRKMLAALAGRGEARVYRYFYNDRLVASDICVLRGDTFIILKTAHDETQKGTSPAHLMRHEIFRNLFEDGRTRKIEFYGPVMDWHRRWTQDIRTLYHVNFYRWSWVERLHRRR